VARKGKTGKRKKQPTVQKKEGASGEGSWVRKTVSDNRGKRDNVRGSPTRKKAPAAREDIEQSQKRGGRHRSQEEDVREKAADGERSLVAWGLCRMQTSVGRRQRAVGHVKKTRRVQWPVREKKQKGRIAVGGRRARIKPRKTGVMGIIWGGTRNSGFEEDAKKRTAERRKS